MAIHRLYIDDFETINYSLIAIHSNLEDYRLAYFINKSLNLELKKNEKDIPIETKFGNSDFARFVFDDENQAIFWNFIQNKNQIIISNQNQSIGLFDGAAIEAQKKVYLLPEFKTVDYFLKIEHEDNINELKIINKINLIDQISAVYSIETTNIKNKNNLIF